MRVLYFHQHFSTPEGAGGIRSYKMARKLIERGHEVTMVCGRHTRGQTGLQGAFRGGLRRGHVDGIDLIEVDLAYSNRERSDEHRSELPSLMRTSYGGSSCKKKNDITK